MEIIPVAGGLNDAFSVATPDRTREPDPTKSFVVFSVAMPDISNRTVPSGV